MQKIATTNMYNNNKFQQVTVLKTQCPKVLKINNTERYFQAIIGFFSLDQKDERKYNRSFLNGSYQDKNSRRRLIRSFTVPQTLVGKYGNLISSINTTYSNGGNIKISDIFTEGLHVNSQGVVKGRGFMGGMRRHNFDGLRASHGVSASHRSLGSTGCKKPNRVQKGRKMPGRMGGNLTTIKNLLVVKIDSEKDILVVKGSVPGHKDAIIRVVPNF